MLREHGAQRPTVFEILNHVHALRGSKSRFTYNIPQPRHAVPTHAPSSRAAPLQALSPNSLSPPTASGVTANPLDDLVQFKSRPTQAISHPTAGIATTKSNGVEARERVLEAIAPMRRGRPTPGAQQAASSAQPSPSPARGDPFAALDSKNYEVRAGAVDELSKRFPKLNEFSIAHDTSGKFQFDKTPPITSPPAQILRSFCWNRLV